MKSGIYIITNLLNNKHYIGSSKDLKKRLRDHRNSLIKNKHENKRLQHSFNKYGIDVFTFEVLEYHTVEYMVSMEQYWMNMLNTPNRKFGFNIRPVAQGGKGFSKEEHPQYGTHRSLETKEKLRKAHTDKKRKEQQKRNSAIGHYKPILQIDKDTDKVVREFESVKAATEFFNGGQGTITKVLKNPKYTAYGFKWKYKLN